jgi:polyferredoxin
VVPAALILAFLLLSVVGLVTVGPGRMDAAPIPGLRSPRPVVIWAAWIGGLNLAVNVSSLVWFFFVFPSIVAALLFWLLPYSLVLGVIDGAVYVRERHAVSRSSAPPRRWAVTLVLSLSIVMFGFVVLCLVLFHGAQLGNFDPGGL